MQTVPQAPQLAVLLCVSTQPPAQHAWPMGQRELSVQPVTHTLPTQRLPAGQ
jgi:hypothetical protein